MLIGLEPFGDARKSWLMKAKLFHTLVISLLWAVSASHAQTGIPIRGPDYFRNTNHLAETLGAAHAIRVRCNGRNDQYWRKYMAGILDLEAPQRGNLRTALVESFNNSFSEVTAKHQKCDSNAISAEKEFAGKGQRLANELAMHYFPSETP